MGTEKQMSYGRGDFGGGLGQTGNTGSTGSSSATMAYNRITQVVSTNTSTISQHVKEINRLAQQLGTELDNSDIRQQLQQRQATARKLCHDTERFLKDLKDLPQPETPGEKRERRVTLTKLANSFSNALNDFQRAQRETLDKEKLARKEQSGNQENNSLISLENGSQAQLQQQLSPNEYAQMQERENAIVQLEADIADVNMIFKAAASTAHYQGEIIESIEQNIEDAVVDIQSGNQQLRQAREHQQAARKKKFIIGIVVLVFILVLFLIIWFSMPSKK